MSDVPPLFHLHRGTSPLVVSVPHAGIFLPPLIEQRLTPAGKTRADTDWYIDRLYDFLPAMNVTVIAATHSRLVIDLNRPPDGGLLYPGQAETSVCPVEAFDGSPLYSEAAPDRSEVAMRVELYWRPYHAALAAELARCQAVHGFAHLLDAHSIRSEVARLFPGTLPHLNFGTNDGASASAHLTTRVMQAAGAEFSSVLNGRFKGGYITRHYGAPARGVQAIQLELAQRSYMDEQSPGLYDARRAANLVAVLQRVTEAMLTK